LFAIALGIPSVFAQTPATPPDLLSGRFQWEAKAPWGVEHRAMLIDLIKLTTMNPLQVDAIREEPFKMFDNLYYVGAKNVCAYLMTTSDGLVLIDSLFPDTTDLLVENIRKVGFQPENIKYIFISHSHIDHFGGAGKIKEMSGARVIMSKEDWDAVEKQQSATQKGARGTAIPLVRDIVKGDGDSLKIGDQECKFN
jgi:glyoxylase-like metal-dependent hydrolase (beta-lactamase superfamily II)